MHSIHPKLSLLVTAVLCAGISAADADDRTTIKNNLLPGHLTQHRVTRTVLRTVKKQKVEKLVWKQPSDWVQLNVHEPRPGGVRIFQMFVDYPAQVTSLHEGDEKVTPTPPPAYFGLSRGNVRLYSLERSPRESPALIPKCSPMEQAVMRTILDFAYWPDHAVAPGQKWERTIRESDFEGTQTFEFVELIRAKDETALAIRVDVTGSFRGVLEKECTFKKAEVLLHWARMDRSLLKLQSRAEYQRKRAEGVEKYVMDLDVDVKVIETLNADELEGMVDQLIAFDKADTALRKRERGAARQICEDYRRKWPESIWMPALDDLERRTRPATRAPAAMTTSQLSRKLGEALIKWEAARVSRDGDVLDQTRRLLKALVKSHGSKIRSIAKSGDDKQRAPAVFALAFGESDDDFYTVQKYARDERAAVRAMALAGMAARRDKDTSVELLLLVLDDKKANVRARACDAVAACVPREHFSVDKIAGKLGTLMVEDKSRAVRLSAVKALAAIGAEADIPKLEKGLSREIDDEIRDEMKKAVRSLRKQGGG